VPVSARVPARIHPLAVAARLIVLALVAALTLIVTRDPGQLRWIALLLVAALPAFFAPDHRIAAPLGRLAEVTVTGLAAGSVAAAANATGTIEAGFGAVAVLPYLVVPLSRSKWCFSLTRLRIQALASNIVANTPGW